MTKTFKIALTAFFVPVFFILFATIAKQPVAAATTWQIQSIDTMKDSRDRARDPDATADVDVITQKVKSLGANYITIDTPYDERYYPVLKAWVEGARKQGLKVWFRGNFDGFEGWFGEPKFQDPAKHHELLAQFITKHPDLFQNGDIFTPTPEPENGVIGDPRESADAKNRFFEFLKTSYNTCHDNMVKIGKPDVKCGYFSTNFHIALTVLTPEIVQQIGGVVVIDSYAQHASEWQEDLTDLSNELPYPIVVGEFGVPLAEIHGDMSEDEQAAYIKQSLQTMANMKSKVIGVNYWTGFGGETYVFNDDYSPRKGADVIKRFFTPSLVTTVVNEVTDVVTSLLPSPTPTPKPSAMPSPTPPASPTALPIPSPTMISSPTPTPSVTPRPSQSAAPTATPSATPVQVLPTATPDLAPETVIDAIEQPAPQTPDQILPPKQTGYVILSRHARERKGWWDNIHNFFGRFRRGR